MKHFRKIMLITYLWAALSAAAATDCSLVAVGSTAYIRATKAVSRLPEFRAWSRTHSFPIAFIAEFDRQVVVEGRCYWSVSVYANRPERLGLWNVFAVRDPGGVTYVDNPIDGTFIPLKAWRSKLLHR